MTWTKELPTKEGWWWFYVPEQPWNPPTMVSVCSHPLKAFFMSGKAFRIDTMYGLWHPASPPALLEVSDA